MKLLKYFILLIVLVLGVSSAVVYNELHRPIDINENSIKLEIPPNTSITGVIKILNENGIAQPHYLFSAITKIYSKVENRFIYAGHYEFFTGMSNYDVLVKLYSGGRLLTKKVTIPEGLSIEETIEILSKEVKTDKKRLLELAYSDSLLGARNIEAGSLLGYLMPETYEFFVNERPRLVLDKLLDLQENFWTPERNKKVEDLGMTKHEIITMASIVEAETPYKSESKRVAGVYYNRLGVGMLLQADPTVQFSMGEKRRVLYSDLKNPNPYNTYIHAGLPPGPINNPGRSALIAALNPEKHNYYYFVARGDGSLRHNFSKNGEEHLSNVAKYRENRAKNNN